MRNTERKRRGLKDGKGKKGRPGELMEIMMRIKAVSRRDTWDPEKLSESNLYRPHIIHYYHYTIVILIIITSPTKEQ